MTNPLEGAVTGWHKSSYSGAGQESCVEQGVYSDGSVAVRDTKRGTESPVIAFEAADWKAFLSTL